MGEAVELVVTAGGGDGAGLLVEAIRSRLGGHGPWILVDGTLVEPSRAQQGLSYQPLDGRPGPCPVAAVRQRVQLRQQERGADDRGALQRSQLIVGEPVEAGP